MNEARNAGVTMALGKASLTGISGAAATYSSSAFDYALGGKAYTKAAVSGGTTPTTDKASGNAITLTANQGLVTIWAVDSAGTVVVFTSKVADLDSSGKFIIPPAFPGLDLDTYCPFAYVELKAGSTLTGTWTFGTSDWNATGLTVTVQDLIAYPQRPISS